MKNEGLIHLFEEYLTYDRYNVQCMRSLVFQEPWLLTDPDTCLRMLRNPNCYGSLKDSGWWDSMLLSMEPSVSLFEEWVTHNHLLALAYECLDLRVRMSWVQWEDLIEKQKSLYVPFEGSRDVFERVKAFVRMSIALDPDISPVACGGLQLLLPTAMLDACTEGLWSSAGYAHYSWIITKHNLFPEFSPPVKSLLMPALDEYRLRFSTAHADDLAALELLHQVNEGDVLATAKSMISMQFHQKLEPLYLQLGFEYEV